MANGSESLLEAGRQYNVVTYSVTETNSQFGHLKALSSWGHKTKEKCPGGR